MMLFNFFKQQYQLKEAANYSLERTGDAAVFYSKNENQCLGELQKWKERNY